MRSRQRARFFAQRIGIETDDVAVFDFAHTGDPDVADLMAAGCVDELRNRRCRSARFRAHRDARRRDRPACPRRSSRRGRRCRARVAPFSVAACSAKAASNALASPDTPLASNAAVRVSPNMSRSLLLAQPSVPMARLTPARRSFSAGQNPLASLRLDSGQCATLDARFGELRDFAVEKLRHVHGDQMIVDAARALSAARTDAGRAASWRLRLPARSRADGCAPA